MGDRPKAQAVADSGPIIHLHEIGELRLLDVFSRIHYSDSVWREVIETGRVPPTVLDGPSSTRHSISAPNVAMVRDDPKMKGLHEGEIQALALCRELVIDLLLTDDLAARTAASGLGIRPVGSLGIVVRAAAVGIIDPAHAENCLRRLHDVSSLFVTATIVEMAIEQLRQHVKS